MKTVIGEIRYYDVSPEDLERFRREAEVLRAQAVRDMTVGVARQIKSGLNAFGRGVLRAQTPASNHS